MTASDTTDMNTRVTFRNFTDKSAANQAQLVIQLVTESAELFDNITSVEGDAARAGLEAESPGRGAAVDTLLRIRAAIESELRDLVGPDAWAEMGDDPA